MSTQTLSKDEIRTRAEALALAYANALLKEIPQNPRQIEGLSEEQINKKLQGFKSIIEKIEEVLDLLSKIK